MKKATKAAALVLTVVMMAASLTACGKSAEPGEVKDTTAAAQNENANAAGEQGEADAENAAPAAGGTLTFGTNAEFPPFEYVTSSGVIDQYDGIDMAIAKNIAEANGMTAKVENMEFESLLIALQNGQIDAAIAGMTVTEDRIEEADFSTPYYTATQVMIVKEDSDVASAADLADKKGNTELLDKINTVIDTMLADGTVAELGAQYIEAISAE